MTDGASTNRSFATMLFPGNPQNYNWIFKDIYFSQHSMCSGKCGTTQNQANKKSGQKLQGKKIQDKTFDPSPP